jgi:hypothetical protein
VASVRGGKSRNGRIIAGGGARLSVSLRSPPVPWGGPGPRPLAAPLPDLDISGSVR